MQDVCHDSIMKAVSTNSNGRKKYDKICIRIVLKFSGLLLQILSGEKFELKIVHF